MCLLCVLIYSARAQRPPVWTWGGGGVQGFFLVGSCEGGEQGGGGVLQPALVTCFDPVSPWGSQLSIFVAGLLCDNPLPPLGPPVNPTPHPSHNLQTEGSCERVRAGKGGGETGKPVAKMQRNLNNADSGRGEGKVGQLG